MHYSSMYSINFKWPFNKCIKPITKENKSKNSF